MNRNFWAGVMVFSMAITAGAAFFTVNKLQERKTKVVALQNVPSTPAPVATAPSSAVPQTASAQPLTPPLPATPKTESLATEARKDKGSMRNIAFVLHRPKAKKVFLIGDFNDGEPKLMHKEKNTWKTNIAVKPGTYHYVFDVDGKKIRDPNNKAAANGKSVLNVKPLSPSKK
jgi:hypothetical protein